MNAREIEPDREYPFVEVARMLPSHRGKGSVHLKTLHRWRRDGKLSAHRRGAGWFAWGKDVLKLMGIDASQPQPRSARQREADLRRANARLERLGV